MFKLFDSSNFTCTSSLSWSAGYTCVKLYDGKTAGWETKTGHARNAWVDIQFHHVLSIDKIAIQQGYNRRFKEFGLLFSNGESRTISLSDVDLQWNNVSISPAIPSASLKLSALDHYSPSYIDKTYYSLREIRIYGLVPLV